MSVYLMNEDGLFYSSSKEKYRGVAWLPNFTKAMIISDVPTAKKIIEENGLSNVSIVELKPVLIEKIN